MAEFCKSCAKIILGLSESQLDRATLSKEPELCEGCGEYKPVVVSLHPTLHDKIKKFFQK